MPGENIVEIVEKNDRQINTKGFCGSYMQSRVISFLMLTKIMQCCKKETF